MGQDTGTTGTKVNDGDDPGQIREEIESTRQELGDTVAALSEKTDVKAQARHQIEETKATVADKARRNPLPLAAAGALAFGFLLRRVIKR